MKGIIADIDWSNVDLSTLERVAVWYEGLPDAAKTVLTVAVGAVVAVIVFKIVAKIVKGVLVSVIAAVLTFLIATVPGNMILSQTYDRIEQQVTSSGIVQQLQQ
ncbi:hypothetical protein JS531_07970 [Bifidobacterium sp. CP2]|uniref:hypothetical protein n=1 Tax=Bifidobacterium TaxID=1678 RepID=UPI001BDBFBDB|nr:MULTISPECIES: hypothetical protein [Bifidobacterium]MBT1181888.1 hypothetical protein [Bifidobacterium sp. CP2]MBW3080100.1 hypothetical protein [Bifidobacterium saguinibicoloris]